MRPGKEKPEGFLALSVCVELFCDGLLIEFSQIHRRSVCVVLNRSVYEYGVFLIFRPLLDLFQRPVHSAAWSAKNNKMNKWLGMKSGLSMDGLCTYEAHPRNLTVEGNWLINH